MNDDLLLEGAVAGHMNHVYDNGEMTFGELKQLLQAAADGKLRGTEKTDGQNLSISFNVKTGRAVAARNGGQLKAGGLDPDELDEFFSNHPSQALRFSFVEALQAFEQAVKDLDKDTLIQIFGPDNNVYYNVEVMNPGNPEAPEGDPRRQGTTNVIPYDKKTLLIHGVGHFYFDKETQSVDKEANVSKNYDTLERSISGASTDDPTVFSVETHQQRRLAPEGMKATSDILQPTIDAIDNLMKDIGSNDADTINDYVVKQVVPQIEQFGLTEDINRMILRRLMKIPGPDGKTPGLPQITKGMPVEIKQEVSQFVKGFNYASYTLDLQRILHDFSSAALEGFESAFIGDNQKQIKFLQDKIKTEIDVIGNSSNERARAELEKQMIKLKSVKGVNTPSEGFVFDWNGVTYKFTGNFAPANQILGMRPFNRFGPIEPAGSEQKPLQGDSGPLVIAILPGSFKPPHRGHLAVAQAIAKGGTKVKTGSRGVVSEIPAADKVYILVSAPTANSRPMPISEKVISAQESVQIWNSFLDKSTIRDKVEVMISPHASPFLPVHDFVTHPADPTNKLVAPPNSTVILGVGDKDDDWKRYLGLIPKATKERPDLKVFDVVVPAVGHSPKYVSLLDQNPDIKKMMKSNYKDYNAGDMRAMIDLAAENPVALELLKDFVPRPEDAMAVMGILGLNPVDPTETEPKEEPLRSPEDQVEEPEIDQLTEIINQEAQKVYEGFKAQRAPIGKKDSGKFQSSMRKRLSKAHATYLDMGRKDLTKYGGGYHLDRSKDVSNAFLAEEELDELSAMGAGVGAGSIEGAPGPVGQNKKYKRDTKMTKEEKKLRRKIRIGLKEFFSKKSIEEEKIVAEVLEEHTLRLQLRDIIFETSLNEVEDPTVDVHDNTGINTLKDLLKNTNILATMRTAYKTLTTDEDQKNSFRAHIVKWVQDTLAPVKLNDTEPSDASALAEQVGIDIEGVDASMFIDADDGAEKDQIVDEPEEEENMAPISGEDATGRNKAERIYPSIEKSIVDYYAELDNPEDQEMFHDYLIANLKLYFDKWTNEMSTSVEEPTNDAYNQAAEQPAI